VDIPRIGQSNKCAEYTDISSFNGGKASKGRMMDEKYRNVQAVL